MVKKFSSIGNLVWSLPSLFVIRHLPVTHLYMWLRILFSCPIIQASVSYWPLNNCVDQIWPNFNHLPPRVANCGHFIYYLCFDTWPVLDFVPTTYLSLVNVVTKWSLKTKQKLHRYLHYNRAFVRMLIPGWACIYRMFISISEPTNSRGKGVKAFES